MTTDQKMLNELALRNEFQGKLNVLADQIRLEVSEAKLVLDRAEPNIPMALNLLQNILNKVNSVATTKDRWNES